MAVDQETFRLGPITLCRLGMQQEISSEGLAKCHKRQCDKRKTGATPESEQRLINPDFTLHARLPEHEFLSR